MGLIDWLWNTTVSNETQEAVMISAYNIEAEAQSRCIEIYDSGDENYDGAELREYALDCMRNRSRLRGNLEQRGYSYEGCDDEGEQVFSREDEEEVEEMEEDEAPQRGFFSRLFFG